MDIIMVIAQRKCAYDGQYGPECLACMTEYEYSDNPAHIEDALANGIESGEFSSVQQITLNVDTAAIDAALFPNREPIPAAVNPPNPTALTVPNETAKKG